GGRAAGADRRGDAGNRPRLPAGDRGDHRDAGPDPCRQHRPGGGDGTDGRHPRRGLRPDPGPGRPRRLSSGFQGRRPAAIPAGRAGPLTTGRFMAFLRTSLALAALLAALSGALAAQEAKVAFGGLAQDTSLPVEVQADMLSVNNADGTAVFEGNVLVGQGEMRLAAARVQVEYGTDGKSIARLHATGG